MKKSFKSLLSIILCVCMLVPTFVFTSSAASLGQVTNLKASENTSSSIKLTWSAVSGAKGYRVYLFNSKDGKWEFEKSTASTSTTISDLTSAKSYKFRVRAYKGTTTKTYGDYSAAVATATAPVKVKNLAASSIKTTSLNLSWSAVSRATGYRIYVYDNNKAAWAKVGSTTKTSTSITGLTPSVKYKFKVRAFYNNGTKDYDGAYSDVLTVAAKKEAYTVPATPTNLKVKADTSNKRINISWTASEGATGYQVEYYDFGTGEWKAVALTAKTSYKYSVKYTGEYRFRVSAYVTANGRNYYSAPTASKSAEYTASGDPTDESLSTLERFGILGYMYDADAGCFYNTVDAVHRVAGFSPVYDIFGPVAICFYDTVRLDLTYNKLDWRIQLWKGQYGWCFIGGEAGVYTRRAGSVNVADFYACASDSNMLKMSMVIYNYGQKLFTRPYGYYWWCTGYVFGVNPGALGSVVGSPDTSALKMILRITLKDKTMTDLFVKALQKENFKNGSNYLNSDSYRRAYIVSGNEVFLKWI